jgi:hypothetical protein
MIHLRKILFGRFSLTLASPLGEGNFRPIVCKDEQCSKAVQTPRLARQRSTVPTA